MMKHKKTGLIVSGYIRDWCNSFNKSLISLFTFLFSLFQNIWDDYKKKEAELWKLSSVNLQVGVLKRWLKTYYNADLEVKKNNVHWITKSYTDANNYKIAVPKTPGTAAKKEFNLKPSLSTNGDLYIYCIDAISAKDIKEILYKLFELKVKTIVR